MHISNEAIGNSTKNKFLFKLKLHFTVCPSVSQSVKRNEGNMNFLAIMKDRLYFFIKIPLTKEHKTYLVRQYEKISSYPQILFLPVFFFTLFVFFCALLLMNVVILVLFLLNCLKKHYIKNEICIKSYYPAKSSQCG